MTTVYVETSAAARLLVEEAESAALAAHLDRLAERDVRLLSSVLLETELRRLAVRVDLSQAAVSRVLEGIDLLEPDRSLYHQAGILPGRHLRSLDALHVAAALRVDATAFIAYDRWQCEAADAVGLLVVAPS